MVQYYNRPHIADSELPPKSEAINEFHPTFVTAPGRTLQENLDERGLSLKTFAGLTKLHPDIIKAVLRGKEKISPRMAKRFSQVLGGSHEFWINREKRYQEYLQWKKRRGLIKNLWDALGDAFASLTFHVKAPFQR